MESHRVLTVKSTFIISPTLHSLSRTGPEKDNAGALVINKAAFLSGEVEGALILKGTLGSSGAAVC